MPATRTPAPELVGITEAAQLCNVSRKTMRRWVAKGHLNAVRVGPKLLKVSLTDLDALSQPVGGAA